ncbi:hypothetical protein MTO96_037013 [Rhipicephalus appendiculatus]
MEETTFVSGITKPSEQSSLTLPSEIPDSKPGPRETILAVIMCVCLVAMISFVVVVVVSSSDLGKMMLDRTHVSYDKPSNDINYNSDNDYVNYHGDDDYNHGDDDHDNHGEDDYNHGDDDHDNHGEDDHDNGDPRPK